MKTEKRTDTAKRVEKLTEQEKDDLFTKLVMGEDATEEVETSRGKFKVKYPLPKDVLAIGRIAAFRRDYKPAGAFDGQTEMFNIMASTLDVVVVSGPEWYEKAVKANKNFTFLEVPSREFVSELYGKAYTFREQVDECLRTETGSTAGGIPTDEGASDGVDSGTFGGLSSE